MNITAQIIKRMANQERWSAKLSSRIFRYSALRRAQEQGQICGFRVFVCNQQLGLWGWLCQGIAQNSMEFRGIPCRVWESGTPCWPELLEPELAAESTVGLGHPMNYMENLISAHKWRQPINQMENLTSAHRWRCRRGEMRGEQSSFVFCAHPPKQAGYELVPLFTHNGCCDFFRCHSFSFGEFSLMKELSKGFHKSGRTFDF